MVNLCVPDPEVLHDVRQCSKSYTDSIRPIRYILSLLLWSDPPEDQDSPGSLFGTLPNTFQYHAKDRNKNPSPLIQTFRQIPQQVLQSLADALLPVVLCPHLYVHNTP